MSEVEKKLYRVPQKGMISGVAAGFAEYFSMDVTVVRIIFVLIGLVTGGAAVFVYIILAIVMPDVNASDTKIDVTEKVKDLSTEFTESGRADKLRNYFGISLVLLGAWFLIGQLLPEWFEVQWSVLWPLIVIFIGVWLLVRGKKS